MTRGRRPVVWLLSLALLAASCAAPPDPVEVAAERSDTSRGGAVAAGHPAAAEIGASILSDGGNAVDAAVAVAFALAVCLPNAGNLGGGGFLVLRTPEGEAAALDFRETAPAAASRDMYVGEDGEVDPEASLVGHRAVAVPGTVAGLAEALDRWGTISLTEAIVPALHLAEDGLAVTPGLAGTIAEAAPDARPFPYAHDLLTDPGGEPRPAGSIWRQPDLADSLRLIARDGPEAFYEGPIADRIVREMERGGGLVTREDLAGYEPVVRAPVRGTWMGHEILSMSPPSSGGIVLLQILSILEPFGIDGMAPLDPATIHLVVEASRRAFADRARHLGDPDVVRVPTEMLLSPAYAEERRGTIDPEGATPSGEVGPGRAPGAEGDHTTHVSVLDRRGMAVSLTTTLNRNFGSKVAVPGAGFFLNDEMDDFAAQPGVPNVYGLVGAEANAIAPGKRPLSSMAPTIVLRDGEPVMVVGSPGGPRIISSVLHVLLGRIAHGRSPREAVAAPRYHHQWLPDAIFVEEGTLPARTLDALRERGHELRARESMGRVTAVFRDPETGLVRAVADPRAVDATALAE